MQNPGEGTRPGGSFAVSCERISYSYPGSARPALSEVSLDLRPGEYVGVVGPNGGGKSTLVRLLNGLLRPESGRVLVSGRDLTWYGPSLATARGTLLAQIAAPPGS